MNGYAYASERQNVMRTIWFSLGFIVALVVIGVMALVPMVRPQASKGS